MKRPDCPHQNNHSVKQQQTAAPQQAYRPNRKRTDGVLGEAERESILNKKQIRIIPPPPPLAYYSTKKASPHPTTHKTYTPVVPNRCHNHPSVADSNQIQPSQNVPVQYILQPTATFCRKLRENVRVLQRSVTPLDRS